MVEHQAGIPGLMKPLRGTSRDATDFGHGSREPIAPWHTTYGPASLVAERALDREDNRQKLSGSRLKWIPRVPAPVSEAPAALARADPQGMTHVMAGDRSQVWLSPDGGVEHRWVLLDSEPRQPQAQRTVDQQFRTHSDKAVKTFKNLGRTALAWEADAQQALATVTPGLQATCLTHRPVRPTPGYDQRGRPGQAAQPAPVVDQIEGALACRVAAHQALVDQHRGFILAPHALDDTQLPPQALLQGDQGQVPAARGVRFLKAPQFLAASLDRHKPARRMRLLMVMTVCWLGYAALEDRIRKALKAHDVTFPDHKGKPVQNPTARWVFHDFVGMPLLFIPGAWPLGLNLTEPHQPLLRLLGTPDARFDR